MPNEPTDPSAPPPTDASPPTSSGAVSWLAKRAKRAARVLRDEYAAGKRGDETPPATIWATPREQLDVVLRLIRGATGTGADAHVGDDDAAQVAGALRAVDWAGVRAATADRTGEAARAAKAMAEQVEWERVQPAAQRVSKALIAAVASGQVGVMGPIGSLIARAIVDQGGLARRVGALDEVRSGLPPDADTIIDTTGREV